MVRLIFIVLFVSCFFQPTVAQSCGDFHLASCPIPDFSYFYNQQSRSFDMEVGTKKELHIVAYENTDYYLSVCKHRKFEVLQLRLYEDGEPRKLLYDNASDGYADVLEFENESTRKIIIELSLPAEKNTDTKLRCTGTLIATRMHESE